MRISAILVILLLTGCATTQKGGVALIDLDGRNAEERLADNTWVYPNPKAYTAGVQLTPTVWASLFQMLTGFKRVRILAVDWMIPPSTNTVSQ